MRQLCESTKETLSLWMWIIPSSQWIDTSGSWSPFSSPSLEPDLEPVNSSSDPSLKRLCGGKLGQLKGRVPGWCPDPGRQKTLQDTVIWRQGKQGIRYSGSQNRVKKYKFARRGNTWQVKIPGQGDENKEQKFTKCQGVACQELGVQARSERPVGSAAQPCGTWAAADKHRHKTCKHKTAQTVQMAFAPSMWAQPLSMSPFPFPDHVAHNFLVSWWWF